MSGEYYFVEMMGPGAAVFDYDNDGDLDVYLPQGAMLGAARPSAAATAGEEARPPLTDRLYRNDLEVRADGSRTLRFTDVTAESGLALTEYGMGVAAGDYDNDGWLDLFVANYIDHTVDEDIDCYTPAGERDYCGPQRYQPVPDRLYRNLGDGTFADVTAEAQIASEYGPGLGVVATDVDGDGWYPAAAQGKRGAPLTPSCASWQSAPGGAAVPGGCPPPGRRARPAAYSRRMRTLRNLTMPAPYCKAIGPSANCVSSTSTIGSPFSVTMSRGPRAVIS